MSYLLDTNALSELRKRRPDPRVTGWFDMAPKAELYLSCLTIGEIRRGIERLRHQDEVQAKAIERWLAGLRYFYQDRIVPIDTEITERWGRLSTAATLPAVDGLLAATALTRDWTVVTRNVADFVPSGARVLNPWEHLE
ncbi:MAG TPA: type II toxin-antitoxin system VapC family toxin [Streptosporangiaceae bacterium]